MIGFNLPFSKSSTPVVATSFFKPLLKFFEKIFLATLSPKIVGTKYIKDSSDVSKKVFSVKSAKLLENTTFGIRQVVAS